MTAARIEAEEVLEALADDARSYPAWQAAAQILIDTGWCDVLAVHADRYLITGDAEDNKNRAVLWRQLAEDLVDQRLPQRCTGDQVAALRCAIELRNGAPFALNDVEWFSPDAADILRTAPYKDASVTFAAVEARARRHALRHAFTLATTDLSQVEFSLSLWSGRDQWRDKVLDCHAKGRRALAQLDEAMAKLVAVRARLAAALDTETQEL